MGTLRQTLFFLVVLSSSLIPGAYTQVDVTAANRRPAIPGLPDWTNVGFERGARGLPTDADVGTVISADEVRSRGVIPDDGQDDTEALQDIISSTRGSFGSYTLIQLPAGVINLSHSVYIDKSYVIIRGASNDPNTGTRIVFAPDENTKYDKLNENGSRWDLEAMSFHWEYPDETREGCGLGSNCGLVRGTATSGWLWPGRSIFRISSRRIAAKYSKPYDLAPDNRKDFFLGSINYHWSLDDGKFKGFQALQTLEKPGVMGTNRVYIDNSTAFEYYGLSADVWIGSPVKANDYRSWGVQHDEYFVNSYVFQDWFTITGRGSDDTGNFIELDHDLRFDVYSTSVADGSEEMEDTTTFGKVMPIFDKITNVGIENLYMTQSMPGMDPAQAEHNYGNLAPESAMHGIVFRFAQNCWVRNVRTFMTGSHPIATEDAKNIQIQDNFFDGSWNKGAGGNGYVRGSRVWDSLYFNNTLRNLRHITMQWSSMGNVVIMNNMTNDMNLHGGWEGYNLFELNYVSIPYEHRAGACQSNCGGEGGSSEGGTWYPIYWSTGDKASKWSGSSGPQNVFYRNYMLKAMTPGSQQTEYRPYWARDGSLSDVIWQFGWDRDTPEGDHYQHLTQGPLRGNGVLLDWQGHETDDFAHEPGYGVNGLRRDKYTSLFLRDVTAADGVPSFSSIAGYAYCRGKVIPKVVGYYLSSAETGPCLQTDPDSIDSSAYTHVLFAYASVATDGTASITSAQAAQAAKIKGLGDGLKVYLAVGGYGLGGDATPMQRAAVNTGGARTKLASSLTSLCNQYGFDGVDLEWASGITAAQFATIATTVKTALGSKGVALSVPSDFWSLSGVNKVTTTLRETVDFISLWSHASAPGSSLVYPHSVASITSVVATAQRAGMFPDLLLMPVGFYGRAYQSSGSCEGEGCAVSGPGSTSQCIPSGGFRQNTYPYYALDSILVGGNYDGEDKKGDTWVDSTEDYRVLQLADGSIVEFDVPASVTYKVGAAVDLCMGGVSVFSIDQDTSVATLETAIWDVGGLSPPAEDIAQSVSGSVISDDGNINDGFWESATSLLANQYPWLPSVSTYRVLVFIALRAQQQVAGRLRNYLQFSDFTTDNFALYRKWETKAVDWALANITGYGRQYWVCSSSENGNYNAGDCPHVFEKNNDDQAFPNVYWKLSDHDGFRNLVNETFGLDIDELIIDKIDVAMADVYCLNTGGGGLRRGLNGTDEPLTIGPRTSENIRILERDTVRPDHTKRQSQLEGPSPYDPDPGCKSTWHGVYQVNGTEMFMNPSETLSTWIDAYENAATTMYAWNSRQDVTAGALGSLLESILTNVAIGSSSIQTTQDYIDEVRFDKELQEQFDAYQAQQSGLQMFLDIGLALLSLIPGIGDGALIATTVVRVVNAIGGAIKIGRITKIVAETSKVTRALEAGVKTEQEAARIGRSVDGLLDAKTLETRGNIGKTFKKNNDVMRQCLLEGFEILMDASDLAQPLFFPDAGLPLKREPEWEPSVGPHENVPHGLDELLSMDHLFEDSASTHEFTPTNASHIGGLFRRGGKKDPPCVWTIKNAEELKGFGYEKHCQNSKKKMSYNTAKDGTGDWKEGTYAECKAEDTTTYPLFDKGMCACDHILEALEVVEALTPSWLQGDANKSKREDLCKEFPNLTDNIRRALNAVDNMEGLWGISNTIKSSLLDSRRLQDVAHVEVSAVTDAEKSMELEVAVDHTEGYQDRRETVAKAIDKALTDANTANTNPSADWKKLYSAGMMDATRKAGEARFAEKLEQAATALVDPQTGDTNVHNKKRKATGSKKASCKKKKV